MDKLGDGEIAEMLRKSLVKQGLTFHLDARVTAAEAKGGKVTVRAESKGQELTFECDKVLVAVGRRPFTGGLGMCRAMTRA